MKRFIDKLLKTIYRVFWRIFHNDEVVFFAQEPVRYVVFKSIHRYLPEVRIVTNDWKTARYLKSKKIPYRWRLGFPSVVISAHYFRRTYNIPEIKKIHIFHGMAKDIGFRAKNKQFNLLLLMGEYAQRRFNELGLKHYTLVGYPKLDPLFDNSINPQDVKEQLGINVNLPTVLYAPTWGKKISSVPIIKDQLIALAQSGQYNVLVKLHDKSRQWRRYFKNKPNIYLIDDPDIVQYYLISDLLISDYSSVIFEFAALDRPIVLIKTDISNCPDRSIGKAWRDIGIQVEHPQQLASAIQYGLDHPEEQSEQRKAYVRQLFYKMDGQAGLRAATAIKNFLHQ